MLLACVSLSSRGQSLRLQIGDLLTPVLSLQGVDAELSLAGAQPLTIRVARLSLRERTWHKLTLSCPRTRLTSEGVECPRGTLDLDGAAPITFSYRFRERALQIALLPASDERWELRVASAAGQRLVELTVEHGALTRLNRWLSPELPRFSDGVLSLQGRWTSTGRQMEAIELKGELQRVAFGDASGLHAGENIAGEFVMRAAGRQTWDWELETVWRQGESFWHPIYLPSARRALKAHGSADANRVIVRDGLISSERIGDAHVSGRWNRQNGKLEHLLVSGTRLKLAGLYDTFVAPLLADRALGQLAVDGALSGRLELADGQPKDLSLTLENVDIRHEGGLFALHGVQATLPWRREAGSLAQLRVDGGHVRDIPLGSFALEAELGADSLRIQQAAVPVLDGMLVLDDFVLAREGVGWRWQAGGALRPVSMAQLSQALKWPAMHGTLSGVIPRASYTGQALSVDGALLFQVFDGTVVVKDLLVKDFLSPASRAYASVDMRSLDLDLLTRAFSFGSMEGRIDVAVKDLQLSAWQPVQFDARVASSDGDYPRTISQRAVENIAALGGASAGAAIQRSFLRFFQQFRYDRIGLSCRLERNVCAMGGIEDVNNGFVIVKGGGIPALSVIGYNRHVGWSELLARLARIRQRGVKPVVQ